MDGDVRELADHTGGRIVGRRVRLGIFLLIRIRCILCMGVMRVGAWAAVLRQTAHGIGADTHRKAPVKGGPRVCGIKVSSFRSFRLKTNNKLPIFN